MAMAKAVHPGSFPGLVLGTGDACVVMQSHNALLRRVDNGGKYTKNTRRRPERIAEEREQLENT